MTVVSCHSCAKKVIVRGGCCFGANDDPDCAYSEIADDQQERNFREPLLWCLVLVATIELLHSNAFLSDEMSASAQEPVLGSSRADSESVL